MHVRLSFNLLQDASPVVNTSVEVSHYAADRHPPLLYKARVISSEEI